MKNISINELENIKESLENLEEDEALFIDDNGVTKYAIMKVSKYDEIEAMNDLTKSISPTNIKIIGGNNHELTYDEYMMIREQIIKAFDNNFKPKPEKLN